MRRSLQSLLFLLIIFYSPLFSLRISDDPNLISKKYNFENFHSKFEIKPYDVLKYSLLLDFSEALKDAEINKDKNMQNYFSGKQSIIAKIDSSTIYNISFDANDMIINDVKVVSKKNPNENFTYEYKNLNELLISCENAFVQGDTLTIDIDYSVNRNYRKGFYLYAPASYTVGPNTYYTVEPLAYTMSEPTDARFWMPCNDQPYDKAISNISIKVPKDYTAVSNGVLDSVSNNENTQIFHWSHSSPISTYLMAATASKYAYYEQKYPRYSNALDTVIIENYCWQIDLDSPKDHPYNAVKSLQNQPEMLRYYSSLFGEYSFEKYGTVAVHPYIFGGMEHTTLTTINRDWLRGYAEIGLAHEIAHHWIGNLITAASWDDIWINEGGASWFEALWDEHINNNPFSYYANMYMKTKDIFQKPDAHKLSVYGMPLNDIFNKPYMVYNKGSWVFNMLSEIVGKEKLISIMKDIFEENKFKAIDTYQFIDLIKSKIQSPAMDLDLFFDEWLFGTGYIKYALDIEQIEAKENYFKYNLMVNQVQSGEGFRDLYEMPIEIIFTDENENVIFTKNEYNNNRNQVFTYEFDKPIKYAYVNIYKVLCLHTQIATNVNENLANNIFIINPNPVNDLLNINIPNDLFKENSNVEIVDLMGAKWINAKVLNMNETINISDLPAGVYFIRYNNISQKFIKN